MMRVNATRENRPLRVAHVAPGLEMGGLERLLVELARHADRRRFELSFVSLGTRGSLAADIEDQGWPVTALEQPLGLRPRLVLRLARFFRCQRIDMVHTHDDRAQVYGSLAARLARVGGVIHTRHGRSIGASARQVLLVNACARLVNRFVCVSEDGGRLAVRQGVRPGRVRVIRNGIDTMQFDYCGPRAEGPVVTVARLSPEKDIATLLRAAALVVPQYPGFRLEVAGDGVCLPDLRHLSCELGLNGRVVFHGQVRDVPALLSRASLFVLPSLSEGISLTLLEAMARGLAVVATRVGGTPEVVVDGATGFLVGPGDPPAVAEAMLRLLRDPEKNRAMGATARRRVVQEFDVRRMVADYENLYQEQPTERRPGRRHEPAANGEAEPSRRQAALSASDREESAARSVPMT